MSVGLDNDLLTPNLNAEVLDVGISTEELQHLKEMRGVLSANRMQYNSLINEFVTCTNSNLKAKHKQKNIIIFVSLMVLVVVTIMSYRVMYSIVCNDADVNFEVVIIVLGTTLPAFLTIPNLIVSHMFSHEDSEIISNVITKLIEHDISLEDQMQNIQTTDNQTTQ